MQTSLKLLNRLNRKIFGADKILRFCILDLFGIFFVNNSIDVFSYSI